MEKTVTIFYVDDNPKSRRLLTSILETRGFEVIASDDPVEALNRAGDLHFDLALLDYQMPQMRGTLLAQELKNKNAGLPVILISGLAVLPADELTFVDVHLGRGATLDELVETIEILSHARMPVWTQKAARTHWHDST